MTTVNPNNGNETKSGIYSNLIPFFIGYKIVKYFNEFYNWHLLI